MNLQERLLERSRAVVIDNPTHGVAVVIGAVGLQSGDKPAVRLDLTGFTVEFERRVLVEIEGAQDASMAALKGAKTVTLFQQPETGQPLQFDAVPVLM